MAVVSFVSDEACQRHADLLLDGGNHRGQCVAVIRVARQGGGMGDELAALASAQRCRQRDLDAELVGLVWLAFADALTSRACRL